MNESYFLVCGLGRLGQACVAVLKEFGARVGAIDLVQPESWENPELPALVDRVWIGDCRQVGVLEAAEIKRCRAILLVTSDEQVNIEVAFAARSLNPNIRLVLRSGQENLNDLLANSLKNLIAFDASQLPATAFALSALGRETVGFFTLEETLLQVTRIEIGADHRWRDSRPLHDLNRSGRRSLLHHAQSGDASGSIELFYDWEPEERLRSGDSIVIVEVRETEVAVARGKRSRQVHSLRQQWGRLWQNINESRTRRVAAVCGVTVLVLLLLGTLVLRSYQDSLEGALLAAIVLLLGGFGDLFDDLRSNAPWPVQIFSVLLALAGTAFVGVLYALLTESLLKAQFQLRRRRPPVPDQGHIVLIGLGRVGQRVAALLQSLRQPIAALNSTELEPGVLPQLPLVVGNITKALDRVNVATAKSVVVVTDDQVKNLEIGLMARAANPNCNLVLRVYSQRFSDSITHLLPYAKVLGAYALAAEAFAAAAFGENILSLFRLENQTVLVTEYRLAANDGLAGLLLAEIAYGYGVVPILHQHSPHDIPKLIPSDDIRLQVGDRLVVLATIVGLQRVERGDRLPQTWRVRIDRAMSPEAAFEGAAAIARISGCDIGIARTTVNLMPSTLPVLLYKHQAQRLVRELSKAQVQAQLVQTA